MSDQLSNAQLRQVLEAQTALAAAKAQKRKLEAERNQARDRETRARGEALTLSATGAPRTQLEAATRLVETTATARRGIDTTIADAQLEIDRLGDRLAGIFDTLRDPAMGMDGRVPVALFPVRIETRFVGSGLKVRVFPDTAQIAQFEAQLTEDEALHGQAYWRARWTQEDPALAWENAIDGRNPNRVAWIIRQTTPENIDTLGSGEPKFPEIMLRPKGPSTAALAEALPARWTVVGYRDGAEVLRKTGSPIRQPLPVSLAPDPDEPLSDVADPLDDPAEDKQDMLAMNEEARWLVDFDEAVKAGMAVEISTSDDGRLRQGYDRLVVLGLEHRQGPDEGAQEIARLLDGHHYGQGLGYVAPGTPTNATEDDRVSPRPTAGDPAALARPGGDAEAMKDALGLNDDSILLRIPGATSDRHALAGSMAAALWEPTLGYFLREIMKPMINDADVTRVRTHAVAHLRPGGPLPTLRIGDQPMGVLPVTKLAAYEAGADDRPVAASLRAMWPFWDHAAESALKLGASGDPAADLVELLQRTHRSTVWRLREALGPVATANSNQSLGFGAFQEMSALLTLAVMGAPGPRPFIVDMTIGEESRLSPIPLVTGVEPGDGPLTPNYIARILTRLARASGPKALREDASKASTLLEALLIHAAELELARAGVGLAVGQLGLDIQIGEALTHREHHVAALGPNAALRLADARVETAADGARSLNISSNALGEARLQTVTGNQSIFDHLASQSIGRLRETIYGFQLASFRTALSALRDQPTELLDTLAADTLDAMAYRYDAWVTSLAVRRLGEVRRSRPRGVHVGGYGWVEDLRPRTRPASSGLIHAPSIPQATAAAILRSGHLARNDAAADPLAIDLSSRPAREANRLLQGMRQGQTLAALLGYKWERGLRDFGVEFATYILPTRQAFPLPETRDRNTSGPVESVAARNVADGVALAELDNAGRQALIAEIGAASRHRAGINALLDDLQSALDAVGDLLLAEGVYQAVLGNSERAAAALDALDKQTPPPEIGITRTPRSGTRISHRALIVLDEDTVPSAWRRTHDARSRAEPRVNAWIARILGDPVRIRFVADHLAADGALNQTLVIDVAALGLSPLGLVVSAAGEEGAATEFEQRLQEAFRRAGNLGVDDTLRARPGPPEDDPAAMGLGEFLASTRAIGDLLASARPGDARDLTHPTEAVDPAPDVAEIRGRADAAEAELRSVANTDPLDVPGMSLRDIRRLIARGAELGIPGTFRMGQDRDALEPQAAETIRQAVQRLHVLTALPSSTGGGRAEAGFHANRIKAVFGESFPVVPLDTLTQDAADALSGAMNDPALLGGDPLIPVEWLGRHGPVRPAIERLWLVLSDTEARAVRPMAQDLTVTQLPHVAGTPWVGRPEAFGASEPPESDVSLILHRASGSRDALNRQLATLSIEQWNEMVPNTKETTGVSFQFDGPGARAPQTMLLAVHPSRTKPVWSTDLLLDILAETARLTRMRTLDLEDVASAGRFLPAAYLAFDIEASVPSFDWVRLLERAQIDWTLTEFFE